MPFHISISCLLLLALAIAACRKPQGTATSPRAAAAEDTTFARSPFEERIEERHAMAERQIRRRGIRNERVLDALSRVPRHAFVPIRYAENAYDDGPLLIGEGQTISQPFIVALMTEAIDPKPLDRILEIGTGSGYQAAVLAEIAREVYTVEIVESLGREAGRRLAALGYRNVEVRVGDGWLGWEEKAPFDAIVVTAAPERVPPALVEQLREGGRLVIPVGSPFGRLLLLTKTSEGVVERVLEEVRFVPMTGEAEREAALPPRDGRLR